MTRIYLYINFIRNIFGFYARRRNRSGCDWSDLWRRLGRDFDGNCDGNCDRPTGRKDGGIGGSNPRRSLGRNGLGCGFAGGPPDRSGNGNDEREEQPQKNPTRTRIRRWQMITAVARHGGT